MARLNSPAPTSLQKALDYGSKVLLVAFAIVSLIPWTPSDRYRVSSLDNFSVDQAFGLALPKLYEAHIQYGPECCFTWGPLGMLGPCITPFKYIFPVLLFRVEFAFSVVSLFLCYLFLLGPSIFTRTTLSGVFLLLCLFCLAGWDQPYWFLPTLLVCCIHCLKSFFHHDLKPYERWIVQGLLTLGSINAAIAGLIKFNVFLAAVVAFTLLLIFDVAIRRRYPTIALIYFSSFVGAWIFSGQNLINLPTWIFACLDLSAGYGEAMAKGFWNPYSFNVVLAFYACAGIPFLIVLVRTFSSSQRIGIGFLLALCAYMLFSAVKHAMGGNQIEQSSVEIVAINLILASIVLWPLSKLEQGRTNGAKTSALVITTCSIIQLTLPIVAGSQAISNPYNLREVPSAISRRASSMVILLSGNTKPWQNAWDQLMSDIREGVPLPPRLQGTADVYPQDTAVVFAHPELTYAPRPAYLSLNAHTKRLANANANYLKSEKAPNILLFQVLPRQRRVENRLPATDDGLSWPEIFSRYRVISTTADFLVMEKRRQPLHYDLRPLGSGVIIAKWGQPIEIPRTESGLVWAQVEITREWMGTLLEILYKSPHVILASRLANGKELEFQLVPGLGAAGFLVSPLIHSTRDFLGIMNAISSHVRPNGAPDVASITLGSPDAPTSFWSRKLRIHLFELSVSQPFPPEETTPAGSGGLASETFTGAVPLAPGDELSQRFRTGKGLLQGVSLPVVTWTNAPSSYQADWELFLVAAGKSRLVANGQIEASSFTDWKYLNIAFPPLNVEEGTEFVLRLSAERHYQPVKYPLGLPLYQPAADLVIDPVIVNGTKDSSGAILPLTLHYWSGS
jgi:hypothetical protein